MIGLWRRRRDVDPQRFHVREADLNARQVAWLLIIVGAIGTLRLMVEPAYTSLRWQTYAVVAASFTTGGALYFLGEVLRRRSRVWAAQGLLAIGVTFLSGPVVAVVVTLFGLPVTDEFICPMVISLACGFPITWHSAFAIRELKRLDEHAPSGFSPILVSEATRSDDHRSDSSR